MKAINFSLMTVGVALIVNLMPAITVAQTEQNKKIDQSEEVIADLSSMKDKIPDELFEHSEGIIIIPKMINAGFVLGGKRGTGIAMVRRPDGQWSDPSFVTLTGGSFGLQAGVQSVDLILFFKHKENMIKMGKGNFTIGADASATAGPLGRSATAGTDYKLQSEIYSYSRSRGAFAGLTLNGASLHVDQSANSMFYGKAATSDMIFEQTNGVHENRLAKLKKTLASL